ncbi:hypothetical protein ATC04_09915 [Arthrobacter sp. YC-RL1]|nr:hypothetical protein ATC04_09915 [Arthrobacter sp. YC-RL1]
MFRDLPVYADMRALALPWATTIPRHWKVKRAKTIMRPVDIRSIRGEEDLLTVSSSRGVIPRSATNVSMFKAETYAGHKLCWPHDLVINSLWAWGRGLGVAKHHGIVSTAYGVYRQHRAELDSSYLHELIRSDRFQWELQVRSQGVWKSRLQMTDDRWLDAPLLVPPATEQAAIVKYLDHANARIDKAIAAKSRLIALLNERKAAVSASTFRSLDAPSRELRHVLRKLVDCEHKTAPYVEDGEYWVLRTAAVKSGNINWSGAYPTNAESYQAWTQRAVPEPGDVIFTREAPVGEAAMIPAGRKMALGQRTVLMKLRDEVMSPQFLVHQIYGGLPQERIALATQGSTVGHFNMDDIGWMRVVVPELAEQQRVVAEIEEVSRESNEVIAKTQREISLLQEFRTRLVADVVTGQVDVRAFAATLPDAPDVIDELDTILDDEFEESLSENLGE